MTLEQLGYKCELDDVGDLVCDMAQGSVNYRVEFYTDEKAFETYGLIKSHVVSHPIHRELNEAIQNKLKELEWI